MAQTTDKYGNSMTNSAQWGIVGENKVSSVLWLSNSGIFWDLTSKLWSEDTCHLNYLTVSIVRVFVTCPLSPVTCHMSLTSQIVKSLMRHTSTCGGSMWIRGCSLQINVNFCFRYFVILMKLDSVAALVTDPCWNNSNTWKNPPLGTPLHRRYYTMSVKGSE